MSEANDELLAKMYSLIQNMDGRLQGIDSRLSSLETKVTAIQLDIENEIKPNIKLLAENYLDLNSKLDKQSDMIESNFVEIKETQTVVEIHKSNKKIHAL